MLSNIRKSKEKGFTIIEVLIVLAIAGLILLVVFLAVPALQRNARNTQRSNDVASTLGAVNEFVNNNNGAIPTTAAVAADGTLTISSTVAGTNSITTKLGYYKSGVSMTTAPGAATNSTTTDTLIIYTGSDCNAIGTQAVAGQARSIAATYTLESAAKECKAS